MGLNSLRDRVGAINEKNGFIVKEKLSAAHYAGLILTELGEFVDAERKGLDTKLEEFEQRYKDLTQSINSNVEDREKLENEAFKSCYKNYLKDTLHMELVGTIVRCLDTAYRMGIDLDKLMEFELKNNSLREFKHGKSY